MLAESGVFVAGYGYQSYSKLLDHVDQPGYFIGFTAVAEDQNHVVVAQPAQVAVDGFGRMQEMARRAGRGQSGADLLPDDTSLADAADDTGAGAAADHITGPLKGLVNYRRNRTNRLSLGLNYLTSIFKIKFHL